MPSRVFSFIFFLFVIFSSHRSQACAEVFINSQRFLQFKKLEGILKSSEVKTKTSLREFLTRNGIEFDGSSVSYLVEFADGTRAVFKPEENLWSSYGEVSGYLISEALGLHLVPPTVIRKIGEETGSLQYFTESVFDSKKAPEKIRNSRIPRKTKSDIEIFSFVVGDWDRHEGNIIVAENGDILLIDKEAIMTPQKQKFGERSYLFKRSVPEHPEMIYTDAFPFSSPKQLDSPTLETINKIFGSYLKPNQLKTIWTKYQNGRYPGKKIRYAFWNGGLWIQNARKGMGPNYTEEFPESTLRALEFLSFQFLRNLLPPQFSDQLIHLMLERRDQVLEFARHGRVLPL